VVAKKIDLLPQLSVHLSSFPFIYKSTCTVYLTALNLCTLGLTIFTTGLPKNFCYWAISFCKSWAFPEGSTIHWLLLFIRNSQGESVATIAITVGNVTPNG